MLIAVLGPVYSRNFCHFHYNLITMECAQRVCCKISTHTQAESERCNKNCSPDRYENYTCHEGLAPKTVSIWRKHKHPPASYLGVNNGAGHLFHIGQVSSLGHEDRFSGQTNLDDEGHPCWSLGHRGHYGDHGHHSPSTTTMPWSQLHHRKATRCGQRVYGDGGPLLDQS